MEEGIAFLFEIRDREAFDGLFERLRTSPWFQNMEEDAGGLLDEEYRGARILAPDYGEDTEVPCFAVHENVFLASGDLRSLRWAIDTKADGNGYFARSGDSFIHIPGSFTKLFAVDLAYLFMEERDLTTLLDPLVEGTRLAGIGDLITTCFSMHGRNRAVGERLGRGETLDQILATMKQVAEGVATTKSVLHLAKNHGLEMPITEQIHAILFESRDPLQAVTELMLREHKGE